jgi:molybdate transport system ATP-binding protein
MIEMTGTKQKFITVEDITIRLFDRYVLARTSWEINREENWAVIGPNGSGKSTLVRALAGEVPVVRGSIVRHSPRPLRDSVGYVSFELHRALIREETDRDDARCFSDDFSDLTTARQVVLSGADGRDGRYRNVDRVTDLLYIGDLLDRPIRFLSTGEMRKVVIARALLKDPELLILDEPYDGLDVLSRQHLAGIVDTLMSTGVQVILVTHRIEDIPSGISHIICTKDSMIVTKGRRDDVLKKETVQGLFGPALSSGRYPKIPTGKVRDNGGPEILIEMNNVTVSYGGKAVIRDLRWTMRRGEHWAIVGPNGSGKTTLLNCITGDNLQAYSNDVSLFGKRRGSGETLGDIRKRLSVVSFDFQVHYRQSISIFDVVLSGFFDSVGLYRYTSSQQQAVAGRWLAAMGLEGGAGKRFDHCSYGEQRLVLLARAMVKKPLLLILDEPCEGLDRTNRGMVLRLLDDIGTATGTHLLYVTHREEDIPRCVRHRLAFEAAPGDHYRVRCSAV